MKGESDAESAGKHTLRVVVVVSGEDKDGMPVTDAEENTEGEPPFEVWAEAHISDDTIIDTLSETVARDIGSEDLLDVAKEMLEALEKKGSKWGDWKVAPLATTIKSHRPHHFHESNGS